MSDSFTHLATEHAYTERRGVVAATGVRGDYATEIPVLHLTPLYPVDAETRARLGLAGSQRILETFCQGGEDVQANDRLGLAGVEYPVRAVEPWAWPPDGKDVLRLIVEDKRPDRREV